MNYIVQQNIIDKVYEKLWERVRFDQVASGTTIAQAAPGIYMKCGHDKIWLVNYDKSMISPEFDFCNQAENWLKQFDLSVSRLLENAEAGCSSFKVQLPSIHVNR